MYIIYKKQGVKKKCKGLTQSAGTWIKYKLFLKHVNKKYK